MLGFKYKQTLWTDNIMQNFMHFIHKPHVLTSAMKNNTCLDMFGGTKWLKFHICHKEMRQQHQQTSNKVITQTFQPSWNQQFPRGHEFEECRRELCEAHLLSPLSMISLGVPSSLDHHSSYFCWPKCRSNTSNLLGRKKATQVCRGLLFHESEDSSTTGCTYPSSLPDKSKSKAF